MKLKNTLTAYGKLSRFLHGIIMVTILGMLIIGASFDLIPKTILGTVVNIHKLIGTAILLLGIFFIVWSLANPKPAYPAAMPAHERCLARFVHFLLYCLLIAMPLSGWIMATAANRPPQIGGLLLSCPLVPFNQNLAKQMFEIHGYLAWTLAGLVILHTIGALKHDLIDKNNILTRMLFGR